MSTDLSDGQTATTLLGKDIKVTINSDGVFINDAKVTLADIQADNGVVHVINAVLTPEEKTGILNGRLQKLEIYPNPATEYVTVHFAESSDKSMKLIGLDGRVARTFENVTSGQILDLSGIETGSYILVSESPDTRSAMSKILIRR